MRKDFQNQWDRLKTTARQRWPELTEHDIAEVRGNYNQLSQKIQQRTGCDKQQAEQEIDSFLAENAGSRPEQGRHVAGEFQGRERQHPSQQQQQQGRERSERSEEKKRRAG